MCLGTPTAFTISFGGRGVYNFEGDGTVGSVMVGAVFVTGSFAKGRGHSGER